MTNYRVEHTAVQAAPVGSRPIVSVVKERGRMSGGAVAALVVAAVIGAVVITMLIMNGQQRNNNEDFPMEKARTASAQPAQQPPVVVNMPPSQPATVPMPPPVAGSSKSAPIHAMTAPSTTSVEIDVTSRLQTDELLRPYAVNVKITGGVTTLSGNVPNEDLKKRAEKLARAVNAVKSIVNDIAVRP